MPPREERPTVWTVVPVRASNVHGWERVGCRRCLDALRSDGISSALQQCCEAAGASRYVGKRVRARSCWTSRVVQKGVGFDGIPLFLSLIHI